MDLKNDKIPQLKLYTYEKQSKRDKPILTEINPVQDLRKFWLCSQFSHR